MKSGFSITYEIITQESAEQGDAAERGFLDIYGRKTQAIIGSETPGIDMGFRDAFELFQNERDGMPIEADSSPISADNPPRWFADSGEINNVTGDSRGLSLHLPENLSGSSAMRIARLLDCYGVGRC